MIFKLYARGRISQREGLMKQQRRIFRMKDANLFAATGTFPDVRPGRSPALYPFCQLDSRGLLVYEAAVHRKSDIENNCKILFK